MKYKSFETNYFLQNLAPTYISMELLENCSECAIFVSVSDDGKLSF
jgi:hypothetical protein